MKDQKKKKENFILQEQFFETAYVKLGSKALSDVILTIFWPLSYDLVLVTQNKEDLVESTRSQKSRRKKILLLSLCLAYHSFLQNK